MNLHYSGKELMHSHSDKGYVKVDLQVGVEGTYDLYISYFKSPDSGKLQIFQRQKPVSDEIEISAADYEYVEKELFGEITISEQEAPLTFRMKGEKGKSDFILDRIHLVRTDNE